MSLATVFQLVQLMPPSHIFTHLHQWFRLDKSAQVVANDLQPHESQNRQRYDHALAVRGPPPAHQKAAGM